MKKIFFYLLLMAHIGARAQTVELERTYINNLRQTDEGGFADKRQKWANLIKEIGEYPKLPYNDSTKAFEFKSVIKCPKMTKKEILSRLREWVSLSFGKYDAVMDYDSEESGKLIVKGYLEVLNESSYYFLFSKINTLTVLKMYSSFVFTVKDGVFKVETFKNTFKNNGMAGLGDIETPYASYFPIAKLEPSAWKGAIKMLFYTNTEIQNTFKSADLYVNSRDIDYDFGK